MNANRKQWPVLRVLTAFALSLSALGVLFFLSHSLGPPHGESFGSAEFEPLVPDGHPASLTVRLSLPPGYRVRYARDSSLTEAGVANDAGERLFYVTVEVVTVTGLPAAGDLLREYARRNDLAGRDGYREVSAEFRATPRGPVWIQRYDDVRRPGDRTRSAPGQPEVTWDRLEVLRYAEVWEGLVLELVFYFGPGRADELATLVWTAVQATELTERPARPRR